MRRKTFREIKNGMGIHFSNEPGNGDTPPAGGGGAKSAPPAQGTLDAAAELAAVKAELAEIKAKALGAPRQDDDLPKKAADAREAAEKDAGKIRRLESAITFNMRAPEFVKANASLLPQTVADILAAADKENYNDATQKADAIKSGVIQSFFAVQANVDLLTEGQKSILAEYQKLTKDGKQEKAQTTYDLIFEPAFEMLKRTKRAEALNRGHSVGGSVEDGYKERLHKGSMKRYGMEKTQ